MKFSHLREQSVTSQCKSCTCRKSGDAYGLWEKESNRYEVSWTFRTCTAFVGPAWYITHVIYTLYFYLIVQGKKIKEKLTFKGPHSQLRPFHYQPARCFPGDRKTSLWQIEAENSGCEMQPRMTNRKKEPRMNSTRGTVICELRE